jgi:hypothetical protein
MVLWKGTTSQAAEKFENPCSAVEERAFRPAQMSWKEPGLQPLRSQFDAEGEFFRNRFSRATQVP